MVRLISRENVDKLGVLVKGFFRFQRHFTYIKHLNYPKEKSCVFAMWHGHQCAVFGLLEPEKINIMISNSSDGDLIATGVEFLGFKTVRGSTDRKGSIAATKQMIDALKNGEYAAIMVDGPRGPAGKVKGGIARIAQNAGVPIVPMIWYCPQFNFIKFPVWDSMTVPFGYCEILALHGDPIYPENEEEKVIFKKIQDSLDDLGRRAPELYKESKKNGLWKERYRYQPPSSAQG